MLVPSLSGRLRNTALPVSHALLPLFEAVVNSIQSIDGSTDVDHGRIDVFVQRRDAQAELFSSRNTKGPAPQEPITGFIIKDNGRGFDNDNMESFETLDSDYKINEGCRGVGRLLWLKAFDKVEVESAFMQDEEALTRHFSFSAERGITNTAASSSEAPDRYTEVRLTGFKEPYQKGSPKRGDTIAKDLLEHCLWYFVREGGAPSLFLHDSQESIDLHEIYDGYMQSASKTDRFVVRDVPFDIVHLRLHENVRFAPTLNWCAGNRVVTEESLRAKLPGLHGALEDSRGRFIYSGYLTSSFLDDRVRSERTDFNLIPEVASPSLEHDTQEDLFQEHEPSRKEIWESALEKIREFLLESLDSSVSRGRERVESFVSHKAPRYRPILRRIDEQGLGVDPDLSDRDLELVLHKELTRLEAEVLEEGHEVLNESVLDLSDDEYVAKLDAYLSKVEDAKKSDLAAYVSRRKMILELLAQAINRNPEGKYCREDYIHNLIMPMRTTSDDGTLKASNLWIVDERLAFHNYLASDKTLNAMPITDSQSNKEPDLLALQVTDSPVLVGEGSKPTWASLSIIEIKRPMRSDVRAGEDHDPIEQCLQYLRRVRSGTVKTAQGRPIPNADQIPAFCYVIADLTQPLKDRCLMHQLTPTADGLNYFGYHRSFNAYIEVISFDGLLDAANQRNRAFFDVVGLPT